MWIAPSVYFREECIKREVLPLPPLLAKRKPSSKEASTTSLTNSVPWASLPLAIFINYKARIPPSLAWP